MLNMFVTAISWIILIVNISLKGTLDLARKLLYASALKIRYTFVNSLYAIDVSLFVIACLSVCHKHCFFFISRSNRAISWTSLLHDQNYKTFFDF